MAGAQDTGKPEGLARPILRGVLCGGCSMVLVLFLLMYCLKVYDPFTFKKLI